MDMAEKKKITTNTSSQSAQIMEMGHFTTLLYKCMQYSIEMSIDIA